MYPDFVVSLGLSQHTLEMIVFFGIIIFILGAIIVLYWKHIVVGVLALSCLVVMANHKSTVKEPPVDLTLDKKEEVTNEQVKPVQVKPIEPVETTEVDSDRKTPPATTPVVPELPKLEEKKDIRSEFMEKCINLADYTRTHCDELWEDRVKEERELLEETKFKGKKHGNYHKVRMASS